MNLIKKWSKLAPLKISSTNIDMAHRMGKFRNDCKRPIICKFVSGYTKQDVIKSRKALKSTHMVYREDLTLQNAKLLERASAHDSVIAVWSDEGKIIAFLKNKKKMTIDWKTDFDKLPPPLKRQFRLMGTYNQRI